MVLTFKGRAQTSGDIRGDLDRKNKERYTNSVYDKDDLKILLL